jgi:cell division protein FtsB
VPPTPTRSHDLCSVVSSINEAHERNERTNHEMNNRLRDLKAAETELHNLSVERERMVEEVELMKSRVREMMLEKLSAERKMSEAIARNTRNEVLPFFFPHPPPHW